MRCCIAISLLVGHCALLVSAVRSTDVGITDSVHQDHVGDGHRCIDDVNLTAWRPFDASLPLSELHAHKAWEKEFGVWQAWVEERTRELSVLHQKEHPEVDFKQYMDKFHKAEWNAAALLEEMSWRVEDDADGIKQEMFVVSLFREGRMLATSFVNHYKQDEILEIVGIISGGSLRVPTAVKNAGRTLIRMMVDHFHPRILQGEPADAWLAEQYKMMGLEKSVPNKKLMHINISPTCLAFYSRVLCAEATRDDCTASNCWSSLFGKNAEFANALSCTRHHGSLGSGVRAGTAILKGYLASIIKSKSGS